MKKITTVERDILVKSLKCQWQIDIMNKKQKFLSLNYCEKEEKKTEDERKDQNLLPKF